MSTQLLTSKCGHHCGVVTDEGAAQKTTHVKHCSCTDCHSGTAPEDRTFTDKVAK